MFKLFHLAACLSLAVLFTACGGDQPSSPPQKVSSGAVRAQNGNTADALYEPLIQQLYIAYFGRPADPAGLAFHSAAFRQAGLPTTIPALLNAYEANPAVRVYVDGFSNSEEARKLYAADYNLSERFVHNVYDNLFSRRPDDAGAKYWIEFLAARAFNARSTFVLTVLVGARGSDAELVAVKLEMAKRFTQSVDAPDKRLTYHGHIANLIVRALIRSAPALAAPGAVQGAIDQTVQRLSNLRAGSFVEAPGAVRKVVLLVAPDQLLIQGDRLSAVAAALSSDLNSLRPGSAAWTVDIVPAAATVRAVRDQLRAYEYALLIGRVAVATSNGTPRLDTYRLPDCPFVDPNDSGEVGYFSAEDFDPRCTIGVFISVMRGTTARTESAEIGRKLDQMIAYHKNSGAMNAAWDWRLKDIDAAWFGGLTVEPGYQAAAWSTLRGLPQPLFEYLDSGTSSQRRDAFVACLQSNNESCGINVHGAANMLQFEGPGILGQFYSPESTNWFPTTLPPQSVNAKYIALTSCSTQNFLQDNSVGALLLMNGKTLLTWGFVAVTFSDSRAEEETIKNMYSMILMGSTFAEAMHGRMENTPGSVQGDPFITMRPVPTGPQPKLVINGTHYNRGTNVLPIVLPDSVNGSRLTEVITYSNQGDADLHLRIGLARRHGRETADGFEFLDYGGTTPSVEYVQTYSDGRVLSSNEFVTETYGFAQQATLKPGQSVAISYRLQAYADAIVTGAKPGRYLWQTVNTSNDPGNGRVIMKFSAQVR